jgi:hypothetical protein
MFLRQRSEVGDVHWHLLFPQASSCRAWCLLKEVVDDVCGFVCRCLFVFLICGGGYDPCSGGLGQAPARQAALLAGLPPSVCVTTVNKVCSSGLKVPDGLHQRNWLRVAIWPCCSKFSTFVLPYSPPFLSSPLFFFCFPGACAHVLGMGWQCVALGCQSIMLGMADVIVCGGMESMTNVPYYLPKARFGYKMGDGKMVDGMQHDGLFDPHFKGLMGVAGEKCAKKLDISRADQDAFAQRSYEKTAEAYASGHMQWELCEVAVKDSKGVQE